MAKWMEETCVLYITIVLSMGHSIQNIHRDIIMLVFIICVGMPFQVIITS